MSQELLQKAKAGDGAAFSALVEPLRPPLLLYLYRRLADREVAEDLCQEVLLAAYSGLGEIPVATDVKIWLFRLASGLADAANAEAQPWGTGALDLLQDTLVEQPALETELQAVLEECDEEYSPADHVDFCFSVLLQSLLLRERNVLLLTAIHGFSDSAAAAITGLEAAECRDKREEAAEELSEALGSRCSLVRAGAPCTQCRDFGAWLGEAEEIDAELRALPLRPGADPDASFEKRLELVRRSDPIHGVSSRFHEGLMQSLHRALGDKGLFKA